jgi:hypothetical protein
MRFILGLFLSLVLAGCGTINPKINSRVIVVDRNGNPVQGIVVEPEPQDAKDSAYFESRAPYDTKNWMTDAQGEFHTDLEDYYWESDSCYHFHVHHYGYEDFEISVAKDLMPPLYKIVLRDSARPSS